MRGLKKGVQNYGKFGYPKGLGKKLFEKGYFQGG
jgi:hypothetical protein